MPSRRDKIVESQLLSFRRRHACRYPPSLELRRGKQLLISFIVSGLWSVNFPAMPDGEQMNPVLLRVEGVNDPIVANASSETVRSFQPMMWKRFEAQSDFIDFRFNPCTDSGWQLEKDGVETCVINLSRRAHEPWSLTLPRSCQVEPTCIPQLRYRLLAWLPLSRVQAHAHVRLIQRPCPVLTAESSFRTPV